MALALRQLNPIYKKGAIKFLFYYWSLWAYIFSYQAGIYMFKIKNGNTRTMSKICSKLKIYKHHSKLASCHCSRVFIVNFEQISHIAKVFPLLLWTRKWQLGSRLYSFGDSLRRFSQISYYFFTYKNSRRILNLNEKCKYFALGNNDNTRENVRYSMKFFQKVLCITQSAFTSKLTIETLEQGQKCVHT